MERNRAFHKRGSNYPEGHRPSVTWSYRESFDENGIKKDEKTEKENLVGQEIGLLYGGSLVMNAIIGPGIFGTPKGVLAGVGSVGMCLVMWTFAGVFSMCAALCFAELRESVKREGVEYAYITEAFGPLAGFVYSWMRIAAAEPCSTAVFALAFTDYVADVVFDKCGPPHSFILIVASMAVLSMALVNVMSTKLSEKLQMLATIGKLSSLSVVIVMGIKRLTEGHVEIINEGMIGSKWSPTDLAFAFYNGLWAYGGWSNVNQVTSGIKKPPRNVPRIVKTVLPLVLIIYLLTVISFFTAMTKDDLLHSQAIGVTWAQTALGPASSIISIGVGLIALGSVNATFLSSGRLSGVAAKNGQMPDVVSWVHVRSKTPLLTVALRCVIAIVVMCVADGQELLRFYIFTVWMFHGSSILALLVLRFKKKNKKRPYKVDLWIPVVVVTGISFLLLAPFLITPKKEFTTALVLIGLSLISYYPINWFKSKKVINVPDKLTIWLQLFLRLAPKRDLRRERRSLLRTMNLLARDSIIITPNTGGPTDEIIRRFSRRFSHLSKVDGSPAVIRRLVDETGQMSLRHRIPRVGSLAEMDLRTKKRASIAALIRESTSSPAIIRKKSSGASNSFSHADVTQLKSPPSLPILKNRFNPTPEATEETKPGSLAPVSLMISQNGPHQGLRPHPSIIQEEDCNASIDSGNIIKETNVLSQKELQVIADFESDGGGEYEVLAHPDDVQHMSFTTEPRRDDSNVSSGSESDSDSSCTSNNIKRSVFSTIFASSSCSSTSSTSGDDEFSDFDPIDEPISSDEVNGYIVQSDFQSLAPAQGQSINLTEDEKMKSTLQSEA